MRIRWTESLPSFLSYPRLLGFFWKDLRESFGERFSFPVRCHLCLGLFQQKAGRWKRVVSFSSSKRKLTYPGVRTSQNETLSGGGLNFAVGLWCSHCGVQALNFSPQFLGQKGALWWANFQPHHPKENCVYCWPLLAKIMHQTTRE